MIAEVCEIGMVQLIKDEKMADIQTEITDQKNESPSFIEEVASQPCASINTTSPEVDRMEGGKTRSCKKKGRRNGERKCITQQCKRQLRNMFEDVAHTCAKQAVAAAALVDKAPEVASMLKEIAHELALAASKLLVAAKTATSGTSPSNEANGAEPLQNGSLRFPGRYYQASSNLGGGPPSPEASARSDSLFIERRFKNPHGDRRRRRGGRQAESQLGRDAPIAVPEPEEEGSPSPGHEAEQGKRLRVQQPEQQSQPQEVTTTSTTNGACDCLDSESG